VSENIIFGDQFNQHGSGINIGKVEQGRDRGDAPAPVPRPSARHIVLMLMSNPRGTGPLDLAEEARAITRAVQPTTFRDEIDIRTSDAVRIDDLSPELLRYRPAVVHFSGHGSGHGGGLVLSDRVGRARAVPPSALAELFGVVGRQIRCVVLNACLSVEQAQAIAVHVPCVVGMSGEVSDLAAREFAASFYQSLGYGQSVSAAFRVAQLVGPLHGRPANQHPVLIDPSGLADQTYLTTPAPA
jgi:hypothetical protein